MCQAPGSVRTRVILLTPLHVIGHIRFCIKGLFFLMDTVQYVSLLLYNKSADQRFFPGRGGGGVQSKILGCVHIFKSFTM